MANVLQLYSTVLLPLDLLPPQVLAAGGAGTGVNTAPTGTNWLTARLCVGAVTTLTTLDIKLQASATLGGTYTDIPGAAFTTVTVGTRSQMIDFQMPNVVNITDPPFLFVRAFSALVGTSANLHVEVFGTVDTSGIQGYVAQPLQIN